MDDALKDRGDALATTREVDHLAWFASEEAARVFAGRVARDDRLHGLVLRGIALAKERTRWSVDLVGRHAVDPRTIEPITSRLVRLAEEFCGDYDGWGCTVCTPWVSLPVRLASGVEPAESVIELSSRVQPD